MNNLIQCQGYPELYGAKPDGTTDCTQAVQEAVNNYNWVQFGCGTYLIKKPIIVDHVRGITISGVGQKLTTIKCDFSSGDLFKVDSLYGCKFSDLSFDSSIDRVSGSYISLDSSTAENRNSIFNNILFTGGYFAIDFVRAISWTLNHCQFIANKNGISIENKHIVDSGDQHISNCTFDGGVDKGIAIRYISGGGLKLTNSKFLNHANQLYLQPGNNVVTGILLISNCSFENATRGIYINRLTTGKFSQIIIDGNQFNSHSIQCIAVGNTTDLSILSITNNILRFYSKTAQGIAIYSGDIITVANNTIVGPVKHNSIIIPNSFNTNIHNNNIVTI